MFNSMLVYQRVMEIIRVYLGLIMKMKIDFMGDFMWIIGVEWDLPSGKLT